jgi:hypothetical protein
VRSAGEQEYSGSVWAIDGSQGVSAPLSSAACVNKNRNTPRPKNRGSLVGGRGWEIAPRRALASQRDDAGGAAACARPQSGCARLPHRNDVAAFAPAGRLARKARDMIRPFAEHRASSLERKGMTLSSRGFISI